MLAGQLDPLNRCSVCGEHVEYQVVDFRQIAGFSRETGPSEWPASHQEKWTNVGRHEAGNRHGFFFRHTGIAALLANAGAILENANTFPVEFVHSSQLRLHRLARLGQVDRAVALAQPGRLLRRISGRNVRQWIVAGAHLGNDIGHPAHIKRLGEHLGRVAMYPDPQSPFLGFGLLG